MWGKNDICFNLPPIVKLAAILYFKADYEINILFQPKLQFNFYFPFKPQFYADYRLSSVTIRHPWSIQSIADFLTAESHCVWNNCSSDIVKFTKQLLTQSRIYLLLALATLKYNSRKKNKTYKNVLDLHLRLLTVHIYHTQS